LQTNLSKDMKRGNIRPVRDNSKERKLKSLLCVPAAAMLLIAGFSFHAFAGAWTQPQGVFYEKLAFNYYYADHVFDSSKDRIRTPGNGRFKDRNITNYFEIGVTDRVTAITSVTYKWLHNDYDGGNFSSRNFGDFDLGARVKLYDGKAGIVSSQFLVKIPGPYGSTDALPLGNGQYDFEARLLYGRSFWPLIPGYGNIEAGYRWRAGAPSNEFRYLGEFGMDFTKALYGRVKLDGTLSANNGSNAGSWGNPTATNNYDLGKLDLAMGYKIKPTWGFEGAYVRELYGKNTSSGSTFTVAVWIKTSLFEK
jgi:protein XagA